MVTKTQSDVEDTELTIVTVICVVMGLICAKIGLL